MPTENIFQNEGRNKAFFSDKEKLRKYVTGRNIKGILKFFRQKE